MSESSNHSSLKTMKSKRINLILQDGTPYGIRTAEVSNWNGKVVLCPRSALKQLRLLEFADLPALYILLDEEGSKVYIGETDSLSQRLAHHAVTREFWSELIAFTSPEFSKTEVRYLEYVLLNRIQEEKLVEVLNTKSQQAPTIRQEVSDAMDEYLNIAADVLLAVGVDILSSKTTTEQSREGVKVLCKGPDAEGSGVWSENGLLLRAQSKIRKQGTAAMPKNIRKKVEEFAASNLLTEDGASYVLTRDHLFSSASSAAAFVLGRSANGLMEWKTPEGKTIKDLEQEAS